MVLLSDVQVLETLQHQMLDRYVLAMGGALFVYDMLIHLDVEIEHIWGALDFRKRPVNKAAVMFNLLYLVQRYLPLLDQAILDPYILLAMPNAGVCAVTYEMSAWCSVIGVGLSELILTLRVWAVWGKKSSFGLMLVAFALAFLIPSLVFIQRFVEGIEFPELDVPVPVALRSCLNLIRNRDMLVCWIVLMAYDSVMFTLMAIPGFRAYRTGGRSDLLKAVYRDGVIYYTLIFLVSLANVIIILLLPTELVVIISPLERVLHSLLASHAILHIREVGSRDNIHARDTAGKALSGEGLSTLGSDMSFASSTIFRSFIELEDRGSDQGKVVGV